MFVLKCRSFIAMVLMASVLVWSGCASTGQSTAKVVHRQAVNRFDARTFFDTTSVSGASFSHDESRILMTSDASGVFNVYSQSVDGGVPRRLTDSTTNATLAVSFFPEDDRFLYRADQGGNERTHLYVRHTDGTTKDLTPGQDVKASFMGWSKDKTAFWVSTNERDPKFFDVFRYTTDGYSKQLVFTNREGWQVADISRDGRYIALVKVRTNADSDIFVWDAENPGADPRYITPHEGDVSHEVMTFTPDGTQLIYGTDGHGEFTQAWSYDLRTGEQMVVAKSSWDVWYVRYSENGKYKIVGINDDARTVVRVTDTTTGRDVDLSGLPEGDVRGVRFSPSETRMAFYVNGDRSPSNLFVLDLESGEYRQLTDTLNPAIKASDLVQGEVVRYKSFDGLKIPAILYKPHGADRDARVPALVWVHGGPGGQSRLGYRAAIQHLVNHGYAILAVNNRGSSGYGKTFFHMDDKQHGDVDLKDCVWARKYLERVDWVDESKVGIIGGSYGGYMVAAALAFEPDAFDVGINIFGVTNWLRTLQSIPAWWEAQRVALYAELGDPSTEADRLRRISPLFHASNISKPLLVVQGANDPRVLQAESDELVEAVRKNGVPVEYVLFPDEGHGFRNKENRIAASNAYLAFLDEHLK